MDSTRRPVGGTAYTSPSSTAIQTTLYELIGVGIQQRATAFVKQKLAQLDGARNGQAEIPSQPAQPQATAATPATPLPEAPASVNVRLTLGGREVQLTLRDSDEGRLLARLDTILQRFLVAATPADETPQCHKHGVPLELAFR